MASIFRRNYLPATVVLCGLALSACLFAFVRSWEQNRALDAFEDDAENHFTIIKREIDLDLQVLSSFKAFYAVSQDVTRQKFKEFACSLLMDHKSIQALEWIPRVPLSRRPFYEARASRDGYKGFRFTEYDSRSRTVKAGVRAEYFPVYYLEPYKGNKPALGFDLASQPTRKEALEKSRDTGRMVGTSRIRLIQEKGDQFGFLVFMPVYRKGAAVDSIKSRRAALLGFVLGVFRIGDMAEKSLAGLKESGLDIALYDVSAPKAEQFLYRRPNGKQGQPPRPFTGHLYSKVLDVAGHRWLFTAGSGKRETSTGNTYGSWIVLLAGIFLTALLARYFHAGILREISERKQAEEALQKSEQKYRSIFENAVEGIFQSTAEGKYISVNPAYARIFGYGSPEELMTEVTNIGPGLYVHPEDRDRLLKILDEKGSVEGLDLQVVRKDRERIWVSTSARLVRDDAGKALYYEGTVEDITARKEAEDELLASRLRLSEAMNLAGIVYWEVDLETKEFIFNDLFYAFYGTTAEREGGYRMSREEYGKRFIHPGDTGIFRQFAEKRLASKEREFQNDGEHRIIRRDGGVRHILVRVRVSRDATGRETRYWGASQDITERKKAEEALARSEEKYRSIFENAIEGIFQSTPIGKLVSVNPALARIHLYDSPEEMVRDVDDIGKKLWVSSEERKRYVDILRRDNAVVFEAEQYRKDGTTCLLSLTARAVKDREGKIVLYEGTVKDITEQKKAEDMLRRSEAGLAAAQRIAHIGSWEWDIVSDSTLWSDETFRIFELQPGKNLDLDRKVFLDAIHPEDRSRVDRARSEALDGAKEYDVEYRICIANGKEKIIHALGEVVRGADGEPLVMRGTVHDITDRRRAEEEQAKLWSAVERAGEGVFMVTPDDNRFTYVNSAFCKAYGLSREELVEKSTAILRSDRHPQSFHDAIWSELEKGKTWSGRQTRKRKDGTPIEVETTIAPVRDASGTIIHYVGVERDITEQLRTESQLRQAQKMEAIGTLAGGVAHDFNNILAVIMGLGNLMQMDIDPNDRNKPYIDQIVLSSEKAADLTQSLLAFSRKQRITLEPHNVGDVVTSMTKLLKRLLPEDIELKLDLADKDAVALLDVSQMDQVLMNLSTNARDAMPKGGTLTIRTEKTKLDRKFRKTHGFGKPGEYVHLSVSDTGMGMDEKTTARIFDPFFTTKEVGKGTGLGLASVYGIVRQHNGYITVTSALLKGTTFDIYLPLVEAPVETEPAAGADVTGGSETILVLEDDRAVRNMIVRILTSQGYATLEASNGDDAIRVYNEHKDTVRLILLDVVMPGKNGREVFDEIARIEPGVKAIFMSGYAGDIVVEKGVQKDRVDFLQKPVSVPKLLGKVREVLDR